MSTFLFDKIIFGPVKSRRLGVSLGINLLPVNRKVCNFNCIYCECGWNDEIRKISGSLPSREKVYNALEMKLNEMQSAGNLPDVITYAGNGEPTLHPEFPGIIDDSIMLRNKLAPDAEIAVLSNATAIHKPGIREALLKVDKNILKLDSVSEITIETHNQPLTRVSVPELLKNLASFNGKVVIQTMFVRGSYKGNLIDNTTTDEVNGWLRALEHIKPMEVMIYTISRDTPPGAELVKVPLKDLNAIAARVEKLRIKTSVSA
ncbi:MAG TPA: hypothetical protein VK213_04010 [Bacteroidales bacterium]|nr:hypothetical protein [Bacteroidales bacterium]